MVAAVAEGANSFTKVVDAVPSVIDLSGKCLDAMVENPILVVFIAVGIIGLGLGVFKKMKRAARG